METVEYRGEYIELDKLLKVASVVGTGGEAHALIMEGAITVDGVIELRKRRKIREGMVVVYGGETITVVKKK